jgi:RNA 3'-terminal phosphate cyclase (ATP)
MAEVTVIDGARGGGQILRNAVALSAVSGRPVRVENIRGARPRPGLRPQHLTAVRAVGEVSGARLIGAELGSREIEFWPGRKKAKQGWQLDIGTAGSVALVLHSLLPALATASAPSELTLVGGTDVPFAPPFDHFERIFAPAVTALGVRVTTELRRRGFYPKGGGELHVTVSPASTVRPLRWIERAGGITIQGNSYSQGLPAHIAERMRESALARLRESGYENADVGLEIVERGASQGCGICLWTECEAGRALGGSALGRRGKRAEQVGREAADALLEELKGDWAVESHLADQMIVWMAVAEGPSELTTGSVTDHIRSAIEVAETLAGARFSVEAGPVVRVRCEPAGDVHDLGAEAAFDAPNGGGR